MSLFRSKKDIDFIKRINREAIERVTGESVTYYSISKEYTNENFYGEAKSKIYEEPIKLYGVIDFQEQDVTTNAFGHDIVYNLKVFFLEDYLINSSVQLTEGDMIEYDDKFFEILKITEPKQIFGKAGQTLGREVVCKTIRESSFSALVSGSIDQQKRTRPDNSNEAQIDFDGILFPFSGS